MQQEAEGLVTGGKGRLDSDRNAPEKAELLLCNYTGGERKNIRPYEARLYRLT